MTETSGSSHRDMNGSPETYSDQETEPFSHGLSLVCIYIYACMCYVFVNVHALFFVYIDCMYFDTLM